MPPELTGESRSLSTEKRTSSQGFEGVLESVLEA